MKKLVIVSLISFSINAAGQTYKEFTGIPDASTQLIIVTATNSEAITGTLQRYQRSNAKHAWHKVGVAMSVVLGRNGITNNKKEGDGKSPAGVFKIGPAFGFAQQKPEFIHFNYLTLTPAIECIDDVNSQFYNQIVNDQQVKKDWHSSEKMQAVSEYELGLFVDYNFKKIKNKGSCIFIHVWEDSTTGTSGCTAMSKENLIVLFNWLDDTKKPLLIQKIIQQ